MNSAFPAICVAMGLPKPVLEYRFHPVRRWRFDYSWPEYRIALEVEGGIWKKGGGRHNRPVGMLKDIEKYNTANELKWHVLKCTPQTLMTTATVEMVKRTIGET